MTGKRSHKEKEVAQALEDVRVLDFARVFSGPFCTLQLAELGAQVIKAETAGGGDPTRHDHPRTDAGESGIGIDLNRRSERRRLPVCSASCTPMVGEYKCCPC